LNEPGASVGTRDDLRCRLVHANGCPSSTRRYFAR
jgi:hypothetical protein